MRRRKAEGALTLSGTKKAHSGPRRTSQGHASDAGPTALEVMQSLQRIGVHVRTMKAEGRELVFTVSVRVRGA